MLHLFKNHFHKRLTTHQKEWIVAFDVATSALSFFQIAGANMASLLVKIYDILLFTFKGMDRAIGVKTYFRNPKHMQANISKNNFGV